MIPLVRRELARRLRPSLVRQYATPVKEENPLLNGYPELPDLSAQYRNPLGWDDKLLRRNFGDTVHHHEEVNSMWGPDVPVIPADRALRQFLTAAGCFVAAGLFIHTFLVPERPAIRREYPFNGLQVELGGNRANPETENSDE
ncbi:hypothetical protein C8R47DRAFT_1209038 [Mycena vitilis]|nr:hypothetical protein C8R47DRAFT_1209038 [Mycena vitilis]